MKIYTRTGDKGQTSLFGGERVSKTHKRVSAYGSVDELNSYLGICASVLKSDKKFQQPHDWIVQVQKDLFAIGSWLASKEASERVAKGLEAFEGAKASKTKIDEARIQKIETDIDLWEVSLVPMKSFILPGGSLAASHMHYARTLCRKCEREVISLREFNEVVPEIAVQYLNRLADALFVLARYLNAEANCHEEKWT